ncbi:MAG: serine O-acetyltransferase [Solirubrobacterales bacterium]
MSSDIWLGHHSFGTIIHGNVVIGQRVKIWHNVTIAVRASSNSPHRIIIEDDVKIGANAVVISPHEGSLRIGRGARVGAGAVVSKDVPAGVTVVSAPARILERTSIADDDAEWE